MKIKSLLGYLFVALISMAVLTGCGNGGDEESTPSSTPSPTPTVEPTPTPSPTVEPTPTPSPTPSPTVSPTATPTSTVEPTVTPSPMVEPTPTSTNKVLQKTFSYDSTNRVTKEDLGNGQYIEYVYDDSGNLISQTVVK